MRGAQRSFRSYATLCAALHALGGCELSGRTAADLTGDAGALHGRGNAACQRWQDEFCSYVADRCHLISRAACDSQNTGVICKPDAPVERCATEFADAGCGAPPTGCEVLDIADRKLAAESCERYFEQMCASNLRCGLYDSLEECLSSAPFEFDCDRAVAITLNLEPCLDALESRSCHDDVPICDGVVRVH